MLNRPPNGISACQRQQRSRKHLTATTHGFPKFRPPSNVFPIMPLLRYYKYWGVKSHAPFATWNFRSRKEPFLKTHPIEEERERDLFCPGYLHFPKCLCIESFYGVVLRPKIKAKGCCSSKQFSNQTLFTKKRRGGRPAMDGMSFSSSFLAEEKS